MRDDTINARTRRFAAVVLIGLTAVASEAAAQNAVAPAASIQLPPIDVTAPQSAPAPPAPAPAVPASGTPNVASGLALPPNLAS